MAPALLLDFALPGASLLARSRLVVGVALLSVALLCLCTLSLVALGIPGFEGGLCRGCLAGYGVLGLLSVGCSRALGHRPRLDAAAVRLAHRQAAAAFLRREHAAALSAGWRLCRLASGEAGAWLLLREIAAAAADPAALRRSERELRRLRQALPQD